MCVDSGARFRLKELSAENHQKQNLRSQRARRIQDGGLRPPAGAEARFSARPGGKTEVVPCRALRLVLAKPHEAGSLPAVRGWEYRRKGLRVGLAGGFR